MTDPSTSPRGFWRSLWTTAPGFALLVFGVTLGIGWVVRDRWATPTPPPVTAEDDAPRVDTFGVADPRPQDGTSRLMPEERRRVEAFAAAHRSIVHVRAGRKGELPELGPGAVPEVGPGAHLGAGFFWNEAGYVVTCAHLIDGYNDVHVVLSDGTRLRAEYVAHDVALDLAVLSVDHRGHDLPVLDLGASSGVRVGQDAYVVGSPMGQNHSLSTGVVSAVERRIALESGHELRDAIQTDAPINPGNSGGPLLDSAGRVVGMVAGLKPLPRMDTSFNTGIGYAIPIDRIAARVPELIRTGLRPYYDLGLVIGPDHVLAPMLEQVELAGVVALAVDEGGPAFDARLIPMQVAPTGRLSVYCVIVGVNGVPVADRAAFDAALRRMQGNASVLLDVRYTDLDFQPRTTAEGFSYELEVPFSTGESVPVELRR